MGLIDQIKKNKHLLFVDAKSKKEHSLEQMLFSVPKKDNESSRLVFLYLDASIESTSMYLSFLNTDYALLLLSNSINQTLKHNLENEYKPFIIYDEHREEINDYSKIKLNSSIFTSYLFSNKNNNTKVHDNCKVMLSTSGTTGSPKLVKLSDKNLLENAKSIGDYLPINRKDVTPLNLPLYYSYGLSVLHSNALFGGKIICGLPDILQRDFWNQLSLFGFTSIAGVPFIYEMLNRIGFTKKNYPTLRYITQAGGNLNKNIKSIFYDYCKVNHIEFFIMYGQTEATARISYVPSSLLEKKITSIGRVIKNGFLHIDEETKELLYSGPNVFGGYAEKKDHLKTWEEIKTLKTGDIAECDEDGFYYIKGRLKRFIKIYGNRVNLDEIETHIRNTIKTGLLACNGIDDKYILISTRNGILETEIKTTLFEQFKLHSSTIKIQNLQEFPLTKNGKDRL